MKRNFKNPLMLLLTAFIWGFAFVAQSVGMEYIGPFSFLSIRCLIGGVVLIPCIMLLDRIGGRDVTASQGFFGINRTLIKGGVTCGLILFVASALQQFGLMYTSVGKAGFLTAMYIILVPILGLFVGKKCSGKLWVGVAIAVVGFYLLCIKEGFYLEKGDIYLLLCAVAFSLHILVIDYYSPMVDGVRMSCIQFFVCGIVAGVFRLVKEELVWANIVSAGPAILYAGILSCGVAYTLQIVGQKNYNPTIASLILSLESVFAVIGGWLILQQSLSIREAMGCVLIFIAIILAQL